MSDSECKNCMNPFVKDSKNKDEKRIQCLVCRGSIHYECAGLPRNGADVYIKNTNLGFFCDNCAPNKVDFVGIMTIVMSLKDQLSKFMEGSAKQSDIMEKLLKDVEEIKEKSEQKKVSDSKKMAASSSSSSSKKRTYANAITNEQWTDIVETPPAPKLKKKEATPRFTSKSPPNMEVLVIKANSDTSGASTANNDIKKNVCDMLDPLKDPVKALKATNKGKTILFFEKNADLQAVKEKLKNSLGDKYSVNEPEAHTPKLKIVGDIDHRYGKTECGELLRKQNDILLPFEVEYVKHGERSSTVIISTTSCTLLNHLVNRKKVNIGFSRCSVSEYISVKMCFKCNNYGHIENECKNETTICPKCSGPHRVKDCTSNTLQCSNCHAKNVKYKTDLNTSHLPWSMHCPAYKARVERAKTRIRYEK